VPEFALSTTEGLHVPITPFVDVVDKTGTVPPAQIVRLVPKLNVGVMLGAITTLNEALSAHWPLKGTNR
jgi:hypothetical protein